MFDSLDYEQTKIIKFVAWAFTIIHYKLLLSTTSTHSSNKIDTQKKYTVVQLTQLYE